MSHSPVRLAQYRLRSNLRRRWGSYLALAVLIGLVGGVGLTAVAAARRTQSSFPEFLASTNPSTFIASLSTQGGLDDKTKAAVQDSIAHLPGVTEVRRYESLDAAVVGPDGQPELGSVGQVDRYGSVDGLLLDQDRVTVLQGRLPDPRRPDEMVATPAAAQLLGLRLGQVAPWEFVTGAQANALTDDPALGTPALRQDVEVVGLVLFHDALVQDDVDQLPTAVVFTPALVATLPRDWAVGGPSFTYYGVQVAKGADVGRIQTAIEALTPGDAGFNFRATSLATDKAERAVRPESIALAVFGLIAAAAAVLIAAQMIARVIQTADGERAVLRALGATPWGTAADGLVGVVAGIVIGALLAAVIAVALSPLAPVGPARAVYPHRGVAADWTVLGGGVVFLILSLAAIAVFLSIKRAPHRLARSAGRVRRSAAAQAAAAVGLPPSATVGTRFALEPGQGATAVPVRSVLLGSILTVVMVVATLTFGTSLRTLVSHPPLYGWNWSYVINGNPWVPPQTRAMLAADHDVADWSTVNLWSADMDGHDVPVMLVQPGAQPAPPVLSGHGLQADDEVVLGVATMTQLHKHVGDTIALAFNGDSPPKPYRIVGTATMPAVGQPIASQNHPTMGVGALLPVSFVPPDILSSVQSGPDPTLSGPGMVLVRMRAGVTDADGLADMHRIVDSTNQIIAALPNGEGAGDELVAQSVQHPAEIVNYRDLSTTPAALDVGLALGAVTALGLTLASSVRRRRRDLALLKSFGFSSRQLAATVAWQASVAAFIGGVIGIPLGIAIGRWLWTSFAHSIYVVPQPTVPVVPVILVGIGALVLANLVAAAPGRIAARTPTGVLLRSE